MYLNKEVSLQLIKINIKKKNYFIIKNNRLIKSISLMYFCKKSKNRFRKIFSDFFFVMRRIEIISGTLPFFKKLSIRAKGKKKIKKKMFVIIKCNFFNNFEGFINFYLVNELYNNIAILVKTKKKYKYLQEFYKKNYLFKHILSKNSIMFIDNFFIKNVIVNKIKKSKSYFKKVILKKNKSFVLKICINGESSKFFSKLFYLKLLNQYKVLLFLYKYFRNKIIKI